MSYLRVGKGISGIERVFFTELSQAWFIAVESLTGVMTTGRRGHSGLWIDDQFLLSTSHALTAGKKIFPLTFSLTPPAQPLTFLCVRRAYAVHGFLGLNLGLSLAFECAAQHH